MTDNPHPAPATTPAQAQRVLVLQGGGALGSYQAGAYQALCHHDFEPEWVAGISIGAINAAIIAGNRARKAGRAAQGILGDGVGAGAVESRSCTGDRARSLFNETSAALIATFGVPGFFTPRVSAGAAVAAGQPAVAELLRHRAAERTLERLVDFDRINDLQDPAQRRRGRRHLGQFQLFRQFRVQEARQEDRPRAHHGVRRAAAGLSVRSRSKASISGTAASPPTRRSITCWMRRPAAIS